MMPSIVTGNPRSLWLATWFASILGRDVTYRNPPSEKNKLSENMTWESGLRRNRSNAASEIPASIDHSVESIDTARLMPIPASQAMLKENNLIASPWIHFVNRMIT